MLQIISKVFDIHGLRGITTLAINFTVNLAHWQWHPLKFHEPGRRIQECQNKINKTVRPLARDNKTVIDHPSYPFV